MERSRAPTSNPLSRVHEDPGSSAIERPALSELARTGYRVGGRGAVWLVHGSPGQPAQSWYVSLLETRQLFSGVPGLDPELQEATRRYDPDEEFVLVEFGPEGEPPRCRVLELVRQG